MVLATSASSDTLPSAPPLQLPPPLSWAFTLSLFSGVFFGVWTYACMRVPPALSIIFGVTQASTSTLLTLYGASAMPDNPKMMCLFGSFAHTAWSVFFLSIQAIGGLSPRALGAVSVLEGGTFTLTFIYGLSKVTYDKESWVALRNKVLNLADEAAERNGELDEADVEPWRLDASRIFSPDDETPVPSGEALRASQEYMKNYTMTHFIEGKGDAATHPAMVLHEELEATFGAKRGRRVEFDEMPSMDNVKSQRAP